MPLEIPTPEDIAARLQYRVAGRTIAVTDLLPIATARIIPEEMIVPEVFGLWAGLVQGMTDWYLDSARGAALDRRLADFGLSRPGGTTAYGTVHLTVSAPSSIAQGAVLQTAPADPALPTKQYAVRADTVLPTGTTAVEVLATTAGAAGNTGRYTITAAAAAIPNLVDLTNPTAIVNGTDPADDDTYRQYFRDWLRSLTRGTRGALLFALQTYVHPTSGRRVHSATLDEWTGAGLLRSANRAVALKIYLDEGLGGTIGAPTASDELRSAIQAAVDGDDASALAGWRAAGVPTAVEAARALPIPITGSLDLDGNVSTTAAVQGVNDAIDRHFAAIPVSGIRATGDVVGQFSLARLFAAIANVPGVLRVVLDTPSTDLPVPAGYKAVPGTVTLYTRVVT